MEIDLKYICKHICNLSAIPSRLYYGDDKIAMYSHIQLPIDPISLYERDVLMADKAVSFYVTPEFHYYGCVHNDNKRIILGPCSTLKLEIQKLKQFAFMLGVNEKDVDIFTTGMISIPSMPIVSFAQMLCLINYIISGNKLSVEDVIIQDNLQKMIDGEIAAAELDKSFFEDRADEDYEHNTYGYEQQMLDYVRRGDYNAITALFTENIPGRTGKMSNELLRQFKNTFIVVATLITRAAIQGGMIADDAFSLSDAYILRCELLNDMPSIANLQYYMVLDFTKKVHELRNDEHTSGFVIDVKNYIKKHLSESIKTSDIAGSLYMSRGHLSDKFKKETGMMLSDFIAKEKIEEAKRLLTYTNKSIVAISHYLAFSSQSHFQNVFKKLEGITPKAYREK